MTPPSQKKKNVVGDTSSITNDHVKCVCQLSDHVRCVCASLVKATGFSLKHT